MDRPIRIAVCGVWAVLCLGTLAHAGTARTPASYRTDESRLLKPSVSIPSTAEVATHRPGMAGNASATLSSALPSALYNIDWYSINGGGTITAASPSYTLGASVGQPVAGQASSASYNVGIGFWHGTGGCNCPNQGDIAARPTGDGVIDVFDVIEIIAVAFSGAADIQDPACPKTRGDVNNDGVTDVFDVIYLIATAFSGGANPIDPCAP